MEFINITHLVEAELRESGIQEGLCLVNAMHITASVFINDDEPGLHEDYKRWLEELAPFDPSPSRWTGGCRCCYRRQAGSRPMGADLLRGVRWPPRQAHHGQDHRGVATGGHPGPNGQRRRFGHVRLRSPSGRVRAECGAGGPYGPPLGQPPRLPVSGAPTVLVTGAERFRRQPAPQRANGSVGLPASRATERRPWSRQGSSRASSSGCCDPSAAGGS